MFTFGQLILKFSTKAFLITNGYSRKTEEFLLSIWTVFFEITHIWNSDTDWRLVAFILAWAEGSWAAVLINSTRAVPSAIANTFPWYTVEVWTLENRQSHFNGHSMFRILHEESSSSKAGQSGISSHTFSNGIEMWEVLHLNKPGEDEWSQLASSYPSGQSHCPSHRYLFLTQ